MRRHKQLLYPNSGGCWTTEGGQWYPILWGGGVFPFDTFDLPHEELRFYLHNHDGYRVDVLVDGIPFTHSSRSGNFSITLPIELGQAAFIEILYTPLDIPPQL
jgi:hypothetical protein